MQMFRCKCCRKVVCRALAVLVFALAGSHALAWDPESGDWNKSHEHDIRIMTWNVRDGICSTNAKQDVFSNWNALTRIVAAMKPDVLVLQETADNSGNGTGGGADSASTLENVLDLFIYGGIDIYAPDDPEVTAYVTLFAPSVDLPHIYGSVIMDGFNRNALVSRYAFADLNGDGKSVNPDIAFVLSDQYAPGGNGGIRGFMFAELDLPNDVYLGDLVMGNAHLKAGFGSDDHNARVMAAKNVAYYVDYLFNGAGTGLPDPNEKIIDVPPVTNILDDFTPVILGGDWNEDEFTNGTKGPADWLTKAQLTGGTDGTDRDRSDMIFDGAVHLFTGNDNTLGSSKLDYIGVQESIAGIRRSFIFDTNNMPIEAMPDEIMGFLAPLTASTVASDHRPVIVDLILPIIGDLDSDGDVDLVDQGLLDECLAGPDGPPVQAPCDRADADLDEDVDLRDVAVIFNAFTGS